MLHAKVGPVFRGPSDPDVVAIDFETYYDKEYGIETLGTYSYITDKRFDPYLVAIYADDVSYVGNLAGCPWDKITGRPWVSHNASFDAHVFIEAQKRHLVPEWVCPCSWDCTADLAVYLKAPRNLAGVARELFKTTVNKTTRDFMKGKTWDDVIKLGKEKELLDYGLEDARLCHRMARERAKYWPEQEIRISRLNRKAGSRGVHVDKDTLFKSIAALEQALWVAGELIPWEWGGHKQNKTPLSLPKAREQCRADGIPSPTSFQEDSEESTEWENKYGDAHPWIKAIRFWRKANRLFRLLTSIKTRIRPDGTFPYLIKYFGAHTGRFSGGDGVNMQNLPRDPFDLTSMLEDENPDLPRLIDTRSLFVAPENSLLYVADLAQIEARVLLYLAGDMKQLEKIASGYSVYEAHARETMGWAGGDLKKEDPEKYRLAKARVLGAGYGCGPKKFRTVAKMLANIDLTELQCQQTIQDFRFKNALITRLWQRLTDHIESQAARNEDFNLNLLSGRPLGYFKPHMESTRAWASVERGGAAYSFWGGVLVENLTQATARDIFTHGLLLVEEKGIADLSFHVHDEGVWTGPESGKKERLKEIEECMSSCPPWAEGLPLDADGIYTKEYKKPD